MLNRNRANHQRRHLGGLGGRRPQEKRKKEKKKEKKERKKRKKEKKIQKTIQSELDHVAEWSENNNLKLNTSKTVEMIIHKPRFNVIDSRLPISFARHSKVKSS